MSPIKEEPITMEEFRNICTECGLKVETNEIEPGKIDINAYISSPVLRDVKTSFCWWNNYVLSGGAEFYGFYEALWKESSTGKYVLNGNDLGDCHSFIYNKNQLKDICINVMSALKYLETHPDNQPRHIDLNFRII